EHPAFHRQRPEGHGRPDRNPPGSPPSSDASLPCPERLFARFPAEKFRRSAYEEGGPRGGPRFAKGALRTPFHPYQRQGPEEPFPAAAQEGLEETRQAAQGFPPPLPHLGPEPAWSSNGMQYGRLGQEPHIPRALEADARLKTGPLEEQPFCCQPHGLPEFCPSHPFHQYLASGALPLPFLSAPHHPYQRMGPPGPQQPPPLPLFPKPIYSYRMG
ncbi:forkhead box protein N1-like, partial [Notechis scutatus]|uniref:Forkhead box protein N1-like n=1 Tax=Notechis scutatus TaxID=8663 RepID=A0A6J1W1H2_9SAUR